MKNQLTAKQIQDEVIKILEERGEPMSTTEIKQELDKKMAVTWGQFRTTCWALTADRGIHLTWDWKLSFKPVPVEPPKKDNL